MSNEQESELERQMFKLEELDLTKLKKAVDVFGELIEKVERAD